MRVVDLEIENVAFGGKGVGREHGKAVFVPYTIEGETVSAEIVREKKQFAEAELVEVKQSSPDRVEPQCPYFGRCGGGALTSTLATNTSLRSNGDRFATRCSESPN